MKGITDLFKKSTERVVISYVPVVAKTLHIIFRYINIKRKVYLIKMVIIKIKQFLFIILAFNTLHLFLRCKLKYYIDNIKQFFLLFICL